MSEITTSGPHYLFPGDRIMISGDTNSVRRIVRSVSDNTARIEQFVRPSKGFRRHVRRVKAEGRG